MTATILFYSPVPSRSGSLSVKSLVLFALVLVSVPVFAGCLGQTGDDLDVRDVLGDLLLPSLDCRLAGDAELEGANAVNASAPLDACNFKATWANGPANEVTIAVNPTDPLNIVAGAKDYTTAHTADQCVWDGVYWTKDGGKTWGNYNVPGSPWQLVTQPTRFKPVPETSTHWCATDPVVDFGPDGTLYYALMGYQGDPVTASKVGKEQTCALREVNERVPCSGVNDVAFNRATQIVAVSDDGGESFSRYSIIDTGSFPVNFHDRQWIDVGPDGAIYVAWTSGLWPGNVMYVSRDGARSWNGPTLLDTLEQAAQPLDDAPGSMIVSAGPEGVVYVSGWGGDGAYVTKSTDFGETFSGWTKVGGQRDEGMNTTYRGGALGVVAASQTSDLVAVNWVDTRNGNRDVFAIVSRDGGATWSNETRLNDDATKNDQFMPTLVIAPDTNVITAAWWDRRNDEENMLLDVYTTQSLDNGRTWTPNARVTEISSDPEWSKHQGGFTFIGDYIDIDAAGGFAFPVWVDTRHERADVYTAALAEPLLRGA